MYGTTYFFELPIIYIRCSFVRFIGRGHVNVVGSQAREMRGPHLYPMKMVLPPSIRYGTVTRTSQHCNGTIATYKRATYNHQSRLTLEEKDAASHPFTLYMFATYEVVAAEGDTMLAVPRCCSRQLRYAPVTYYI